MSAPRAKPTLATLPQEVLMIVLEHSNDLDSLLSSIASCLALFNAYCGFSVLRSRNIVFREIDTAVLPEAVLAIQAAQARHASPQDSGLPAIVRHIFTQDREALLDHHKWDLRDVVAAVSLHSLIDNLARKFGSLYLASFEELTESEQEDPSGEELARIKRALYRFEIYCRPFPPRGDTPGLDYVRAQTSFLQVRPW